MTTTFIDLLFYNRKLERLVEIDLKLGALKAEYQSVSVCRKATKCAYAPRELGGTQGNLLARRHHRAVRVFRHYRANGQTVVRCHMQWLSAG